MTPEQKARQEIDRQLEACGWMVQDYRSLNIAAGPGVAVREFPLASGPADYLLYVDRKAIGVIEAKPVGHSIIGVEPQSARYTEGLPNNVPHHRLPLPFAYESTGKATRFTNSLEPDYRSREVFTFHRPEELNRLATLPAQLRTNLRNLPPLNTAGLWAVQESAIRNLEQSLSRNQPRSLIQMATGSGKTFTAVSACYRLIKFGEAKRILFLVDRTNLGKQTEREFQQYNSPYTNRSFAEEYVVQRLSGNSIAPSSKVCITTIQRLYAILQGEETYDEANEEVSAFESAAAMVKKPAPVAYNPNVPIETFDFIVIDECHRSIYNLWRQVLDYFDAFLIGLTATPSKQTIGFFNQNLVEQYDHTRAVADGVNVPYDVYTISTEITASGATLTAEPQLFIPHRDKRTKEKVYRELDDDLNYAPNHLDRDVVAKDQIRLVLKTFRDKLFTEIFPGRTEVPKTLIFAKNDQHAEDIVEMVREVFGKGAEFCQKITSKAKKPEELLQQFRTGYHPRIAVTVDMIATGTDVKPLECLLFMRDVRSAGYFEQMKGRGCRIVDPDLLQSVTPDARHKTRFVLVDAVGVCHSDKTSSKPLDRKPTVSLDKLLETVKTGACDSDIASTLGARLARLNLEVSPQQHEQIARKAGGKSLGRLAGDLLESVDADRVTAQARQQFGLAAGQDPDDAQYDAAETELMQAAIQPFFNAELRETIVNVRRTLEQVIDEITADRLLFAGADPQAKEAAARTMVANFEQFVAEHKGEIEALQILYSQPYRAGLRYRHVKELAEAIRLPPLSASPDRLWQAYQVLQPEKVRGPGGLQLADIVALVRHAIEPDSPLAPVQQTVEERYQAWLADQRTAGATFTPEQQQWLDAIRDHIATSLAIEPDDFDDVPFSTLGGLGRAHQLFGENLTAILDDLNGRLAV